jgi:predicted  nucleic acid-binding Zn-ribbon protein
VSLPKNIKTTTELKALQLEEKALQAQKIARQALLEPLQEKVEQLVMESDAAKKNIEQIGAEGRELLQSPITEQVVTSMADKSSQAQQQCQRITKMYDTL